MSAVVAVFLICFAPRAAYLWWFPEDDSFPSYYWILSENLLRSGVLGLEDLPSTAHEPLYPMFLAASRWLTGDALPWVMVPQIAIASLGGVYLYRLCQHLADDRAARVCVLVYALYPYLVRQASSVSEITVLSSLMIAAAFHFCRKSNLRSAAVAGAILGLAFLARAAVLPLLGLGVAFLIWRRQGGQALAVALAACLVASPMVLRNILLDGSVLPTRSGANLYAGNNRYADFLIPAYNTDLLSTGDLLRRDAPHLSGLSGLDEAGIDAIFRDQAIEWMLQEPLRVLRLKLWNIAYFFHPRLVPYYPVDEHSVAVFTPDGGIRVEGIPARPAALELLHAVCYGLILIGAIAGAWQRRRRVNEDAILYLMLLAFAAVASVFFPTTRLRAPVEFVPMFFAACAIARWSHRG